MKKIIAFQQYYDTKGEKKRNKSYCYNESLFLEYKEYLMVARRLGEATIDVYTHIIFSFLTFVELQGKEAQRNKK